MHDQMGRLAALAFIAGYAVTMVASVPFRCAHGKFISKTIGCECEVNFTGPTCIREMHCDSTERNNDGSCLECDKGWTGADCDEIVCQNGKQNADRQRCLCDQPFSGVFCEKLRTEDVYSLYNNRASSMGPLGALSIIPMILMVWFCNRKATKRQNQRVQNQMISLMSTQIDARVISKLMEEEEEEPKHPGSRKLTTVLENRKFSILR